MFGAVRLVVIFVSINSCFTMLWKKGIVHFNINKLDYDINSQEVITSTLAKLQDEICVKFFQYAGPPANDTKLLYISNPDKIKSCQPNAYDFQAPVITMPIGYRCLNSKAIARTVAEMLRASIDQTVGVVNSYDLAKKFQDKGVDPSLPTLLPPVDRNFINLHYHYECGAIAQPVPRRRAGESATMSDDNVKYYENKVWPLGIVLYGVEDELRDTKAHSILQHAMATIELSTCVVFQEVRDEVLTPRNFIWFGEEGLEDPLYGFQEGNQTINLKSMTSGAAGHTAHTLNNLMRILGVHMMSNRHDRNNYVTVNWRNVRSGKEHLLEKAPAQAWLAHLPYDWDSATHAPANFACRGCELGDTAVQPLQDHLWSKTLSMGHTTGLSAGDVQLLNILYGKQCQDRFISKAEK